MERPVKNANEDESTLRHFSKASPSLRLPVVHPLLTLQDRLAFGEQVDKLVVEAKQGSHHHHHLQQQESPPTTQVDDDDTTVLLFAPPLLHSLTRFRDDVIRGAEWLTQLANLDSMKEQIQVIHDDDNNKRQESTLIKANNSADEATVKDKIAALVAANRIAATDISTNHGPTNNDASTTVSCQMQQRQRHELLDFVTMAQANLHAFVPMQDKTETFFPPQNDEAYGDDNPQDVGAAMSAPVSKIGDMVSTTSTLYNVWEPFLTTTNTALDADTQRAWLAVAVLVADEPSVRLLLAQQQQQSASAFDMTMYAIQLACFLGHKALVQRHVQEQEFCFLADNDSTSEANATVSPLWYAVFGNQTKVVEYLLQQQPIDKKMLSSHILNNALSMAAFYGLVDMVQCLWPHVTEAPHHALHHAAAFGTDASAVDMLQLLLNTGANVNTKCQPNGTTPLHWAFYAGNTDAAELLLDCGADLLLPSDDGITPYKVARSFCANIWNDRRFFQYWTRLVQQGDKERLASLWAAMPDLRFAAKRTMLLACRYNSTRVLQMMLDEDFPVNQRLDADRNTPLLVAVVSHSLDVVDMLLAAGAKVTSVDKQGWAPLHCACQEGDDRTVLIAKLVAHGANLNALTGDGESALLLAVKNDNMNHVQCLVAHGANVNGMCLPRFAVLHLASYTGRFDIAQYLLDHGAETEILSYEGYTALQYASEQGHAQIVKCLVEKGANLHSKLKDGRTPLYMACSQHHVDVVRALLEGGAEVDQKSFNDFSALHCACFLGRIDLVEMLLTHGADPYNKTPCGQSAMDLATERGHEQILEMLLAWDFAAALGNWEQIKAPFRGPGPSLPSKGVKRTNTTDTPPKRQDSGTISGKSILPPQRSVQPKTPTSLD